LMNKYKFDFFKEQFLFSYLTIEFYKIRWLTI
jgi:hypothetical protein